MYTIHFTYTRRSFRLSEDSTIDGAPAMPPQKLPSDRSHQHFWEPIERMDFIHPQEDSATSYSWFPTKTGSSISCQLFAAQDEKPSLMGDPTAHFLSDLTDVPDSGTRKHITVASMHQYAPMIQHQNMGVVQDPGGIWHKKKPCALRKRSPPKKAKQHLGWDAKLLAEI